MIENSRWRKIISSYHGWMFISFNCFLLFTLRCIGYQTGSVIYWILQCVIFFLLHVKKEIKLKEFYLILWTSYVPLLVSTGQNSLSVQWECLWANNLYSIGILMYAQNGGRRYLQMQNCSLICRWPLKLGYHLCYRNVCTQVDFHQ